MTIKKTDPIASRLCEKFGCHGCKHQVADDDFLLQHEMFWCTKRKQSFAAESQAHAECPTWQFNGSEDLLKLVSSNQEPLPFAED